MARTYSLDLRERVIAAVASGQRCRRVVATFGVEPSMVVKWLAGLSGHWRGGGQAVRCGRWLGARAIGGRVVREHVGAGWRACRGGRKVSHVTV